MMKNKEEIEKVILEIEAHIVCDKEYGEMKKFPFFGEVNTNLTTVQGIRKVLLWVLDKHPNDCCPIRSVNRGR